MATGMEHITAGQQVALGPSHANSLDAPVSREEFSFFGEDGFTFTDVLDVINPLQHIPFVSTMYRDATDDTIAAAPRVLGATLFFGPIGLVSALTNVAVEESTGKDIGEHMADIFGDDEQSQDAATAHADNTININGTATEPTDPVLAWAQREASWSRSHNDPSKEKAVHDRVLPSSVPDAGPFVQDKSGDLAGLYARSDSVAFLSDDVRSAARAYAAASGLTEGRA